ncbi:hypothetical protein CDL15_Pgr017879 [Punica granatum]|uniref:Generative cell specific-1/HAP2 domain-containing protein n=1 Tax=Punica granatum TaxID=22663 RepID=A0A218WH33_PUNGR|nr:hypothetical protein CDL15_Pgr017879 [Punica granatum]
MSVTGTQILSKSKLDKCEKTSESDSLNCTRKIVLNLAVPSGSSGGEASLVAEIVEAEENSSSKMQTLRVPPVLTINKSSAYALYELTYIRDVPFKPQEYFVKTRKCEPDADAKVVKICCEMKMVTLSSILSQFAVPVDHEDEFHHHVEMSVPCIRYWTKIAWIQCSGRSENRKQSLGGFHFSLSEVQQKWLYTVYCNFHLTSSLALSLSQEVVVGPENRTATSNDNFLRVNLIGDFAGYTNIPSFEDFYLVIPRQADQNRVRRNQLPLYGVEGRFERINQHPVMFLYFKNAGTHSFSIGVTEVLNTNLLIELSADDIEYVYQRSPGKILSVTIPTFEALSQFGVATVTIQNVGKVEASYSLVFDCSKGITLTEEQFFIMKPNEVLTRSFKLHPTTDQAAKYVCAAILKDSDFSEVDRAECQFSTTATVLDNGTQITAFQPPKTSVGFFDSIKKLWNRIWEAVIGFITGKSCRRECSGFFDFSCHIQYICMSWVLLFGLLLATFPTVLVLLWLLHQKGFFDPLYDWWEDHFEDNSQGTRISHAHRHGHGPHGHHTHHNKRHHREGRHHKNEKRRHHHREQGHMDRDPDYYYYLHHVHKDKFKNRHGKSSGFMALDELEDETFEHHEGRRTRRSSEGTSKLTREERMRERM